MPINVAWLDDECTILVISYHDPWNWEEFYSAMGKIKTLVPVDAPPPFAVINDYSHSTSIPADALPHFRQQADAVVNNPAETLYVMVDVKGLWQTLGRIMQQNYPQVQHRTFHVGNLEEAKTLLASKKTVDQQTEQDK